MFDWKWRLSEIRHDKPVSVFSMFSCGGGSSMGYKRAGFDVIGNVEIDEKINRMYVKNLHPRFNFNMDAREFVKKQTFRRNFTISTYWTDRRRAQHSPQPERERNHGASSKPFPREDRNSASMIYFLYILRP